MERVEIVVSPDEMGDSEAIRRQIFVQHRIPIDEISAFIIDKKSLDARHKPVFRIQLTILRGSEVYKKTKKYEARYRDVSTSEELLIIGAGPAGYFAALKCLEVGFKPIVLERGKNARDRRRDLRAIQQMGIVDSDSNYGFGEGGAGTYSDGKLYTRSKKRGSIDEVLQKLVDHGASPEILIEAHPHIGSNKLPQIIMNIRHTIESCGGRVLFGHRVIDFVIQDDRIHGVFTNKGRFDASRVILATGHSSREIYRLFQKNKWKIEAKSFALGLRIEHPQSVVDEMQYGQFPRHPNLPAAAYQLACEINRRGVYSFCMCPGGLIVPASTAPGEIVVNGMSLSRRDSPYANSGMVVSVSPEDLKKRGFNGVFACLEFQQQVEQNMFLASDGTQRAPAQKVIDFMNGTSSVDLPSTSYIPGLLSSRLDLLLPDDITRHLRQGFLTFSLRMKQFFHPDAILVGVESRTSAPLRIPRSPITLEHPQIAGLYPCGEGAGYAGGIVSAAIDGQQVAQTIANNQKVFP